MQVWNVLHGARCKYRTQKVVKKSPSGHHRTTLSRVFAIKARIDNRKKTFKQQYLLHMFPQYGELRPTSGWDRSSIGRQPNFAALNRGRHLCSAGRPSCWALAHILVSFIFSGYSSDFPVALPETLDCAVLGFLVALKLFADTTAARCR